MASRWDGTTVGIQLPLMGNFKVVGPSVTYVMCFVTVACAPASLDQSLVRCQVLYSAVAVSFLVFVFVFLCRLHFSLTSSLASRTSSS